MDLSYPLASPAAAARQITSPLASPAAAARQITSPLASPAAAARQTTALDLADAARSPNRAAQAAQDFEALLLGQILKGLRRTVPEAEEKSAMSQTYYELFDERVAVELAKKGGIGIATIIRAYLDRAEPGGPRP